MSPSHDAKFSAPLTNLKKTSFVWIARRKSHNHREIKLSQKTGSIMIHLAANYRQFFGVANRRYRLIMATREMYTSTHRVARHVRTGSIVTNKLETKKKMTNTRLTKTIIKSFFFW
uniref:(northern house mosquito) hypothetical protein n=1 Tax=Culex pipiens TaxID=7175 RepID=A0A8D8DW53_CULPI